MFRKKNKCQLNTYVQYNYNNSLWNSLLNEGFLSRLTLKPDSIGYCVDSPKSIKLLECVR